MYAFALWVSWMGVASACPGTNIATLVSRLDLNGIFPITIGGTPVQSGHLPDTPNPSNPVCVCPDHPVPEVGLAEGFWEPMMVVEVTRTPGCLVALGGVNVPSGLAKGQGSGGTNPNAGQQTGFYHVHVYQIPIMQWIGAGLLGGSCQTDSNDFGVAYMSEFDPTWQSDAVAEEVYPETFQFANSPTTGLLNGACAVDAASAVIGLPLDRLYWCDGSHGTMYPLTGTVDSVEGPIGAGRLVTERALYKLHRLLMMTDTSPSNLCSETLTVPMPKSRYRAELAYPLRGETAPFGRSPFLNPISVGSNLNGDTVFWIFRKKNCCNY